MKNRIEIAALIVDVLILAWLIVTWLIDRGAH
jgi:hypothetical protein